MFVVVFAEVVDPLGHDSVAVMVHQPYDIPAIPPDDDPDDSHHFLPLVKHVALSLIGQLVPPLAHHPEPPYCDTHHSPLIALQSVSVYAGHVPLDWHHPGDVEVDPLHHLLPLVAKHFCSSVCDEVVVFVVVLLVVVLLVVFVVVPVLPEVVPVLPVVVPDDELLLGHCIPLVAHHAMPPFIAGHQVPFCAAQSVALFAGQLPDHWHHAMPFDPVHHLRPAAVHDACVSVLVVCACACAALATKNAAATKTPMQNRVRRRSGKAVDIIK